MSDQARSILFKTLDIIGYADDKEEFVNRYLQNCYELTIEKLLQTLPKEKQEELRKFISSQDTTEQIREKLLKNFSKDQLLQTLDKVVEEYFVDYLNSVAPALNNDKRHELDKYLSSLSNST